VGVLFADEIVSAFPELIVSAEAIGGAATALAVMLAVIGGGHLILWSGLRRRRRWARVGAVVGGIGLVFLLGMSSVAAVVTTLTQPASAGPLLVGAAILAAVAVVEGWLVIAALRQGPQTG
jgi:hypothetical protein